MGSILSRLTFIEIGASFLYIFSPYRSGVMTNLERDKQPIIQPDKRMFKQKDKLAGEKERKTASNIQIIT